MPETCSFHALPPHIAAPFQDENYFLLPGLQFNNRQCCPNITSLLIPGNGRFDIHLLQMAKSQIYNDSYYVVNRHTIDTQHPIRIARPIQVHCQKNVIIAIGVICKPRFRECVFNKTMRTSAQRSNSLWHHNESRLNYITFHSGQYSCHPVFSLSLSCK